MKNIFLIALLAILYIVTGKISLELLSGNDIVNVGMFVPEGIALAFVIFFGKRVWPGVFLGQLILALSNSINLFASLEISAINSIEAVLGFMLFNYLKLDSKLKTSRDFGGLIFIIMLVLQPFSALLSNLVLLFHGSIIQDDFILSIFSWWFGNVMGQLLFTPFLLLLFNNYKDINIKDFFLKGFLFGLYVYILLIVLVIENSFLLFSLTMPIVLFVVSKNNMLYGIFMNIIVSFIASYSIYVGIGAFDFNSSLDNSINYNLFVLAHISMVLTIGVLFENRRKYESRLEEMIEIEVNKNKEQQLLMLHQSRFAQMGEMISMIAHQWRQPLNNLALINQLLVSKYRKNKLDDEAIEYFKNNSNKQIQLMSSTIDDFRNFFKTEKLKSRFIVNDVIEKILDMTKDIYSNSGITINYNQTTGYEINGYSNELAQVIINIINNAKDALIDNKIKNKEIKIKIEENMQDIIISISDNAGGIPPGIIDKIFDPYFSTKTDKNGTGLGLYMAKMIITEQMNSNIYVHNDKDGAVFEIHLKGDN